MNKNRNYMHVYDNKNIIEKDIRDNSVKKKKIKHQIEKKELT